MRTQSKSNDDYLYSEYLWDLCWHPVGSWDWLINTELYSVYSPNRCYPAYVITYKIINRHNKQNKSSEEDSQSSEDEEEKKESSDEDSDDDNSFKTEEPIKKIQKWNKVIL